MKYFRLSLTIALLFPLRGVCQTFNLVWADEFNGTGSPDTTKWGREIGIIRNGEAQYYTNSINNARQKNGNLEITVRQEPMNGFKYTSASLITLRKTDWIYGKIEGRFKIPSGKGLWSCFWTLGANYEQISWPRCGEMDIFEHINTENLVHGTAHYADINNQHASHGHDSPVFDVTQWHNYSVVWTPDSIKWFVDSIQFHGVNIKNNVNSTEEFHKPHYVLINLPIGGSWPGSPDSTTVLPATMYCDYIRVYQYVPPGSASGNQFINCGGGEIKNFAADKWYSTGASLSYNNPIDTTGVVNSAPSYVYQSNRSGNLIYTISGLIPNAVYTTRLHFAENVFSEPGGRLFNVNANDNQILTGFDIFSAAGNRTNKAVIKEFVLTADGSGNIVLQFVSIKNKAQINGIEIIGRL